jgi:hypothetical protein
MRRGVLTGVVVTALALLVWVPVAAAATTATSVLPYAFKVPATNGYTAEAFGLYNPELNRGVVTLTLRRGGTSATYITTQAAFTEDSFEADFGALGEIDVHSVPSGATTTERSSCGGRPVPVPAGRWEGTISFRGEEGFAAVDATSAGSYVKPLLDILCFAEVDEGFAGNSPGALLTVKRHRGTEKLDLNVRKNKPTGPTRINADLYERRGGITIERTVAAVAPSKAFQFEIPPGRATVGPSGPLSGTLELTRRPGSSPQVNGGLMVDFPGRADVPVLAPGKPHASLVRAVLNPSHPY